MEIRRKKIGTRKWEFVNEYWETRHSWGHKTTIFRNGYQYEPHKVRYLNRTWEMYTYQTCMFGAVAEIREQELARFIDNYKWEHNIYRFRKGEKQKVEQEFEKTEIAKDLKKLRQAVADRNFDR